MSARRSLAVLALAATALLPSCGGSDQAEPTSCTRVEPGPDGTTTATIVGENLAFDVGCLEVRPGPIELTFDNRDAGVVHNLHLTGHGVDASTELDTEGTYRLTAELTEVGRYTYACDPHASMEGVLRVVEAPAGSAPPAGQ